jgi:hypothetical protein
MLSQKSLSTVLAAVLLAAAAGSAQAALVVHYKLDDAGGGIAQDSAGGFNGTLTNMDPATAWITGQIDGALQFDGLDDYVSMPGLNLNTGSITISAWIYSNAAQNGYAGLVFRRSGNEDASGFGFTSGNQLGYHWNNAEWDWQSGLVVPNGRWVFAAIAIGPTQATAYLGDPQGGTLDSAVNSHAGYTEQFNGAAVGADLYTESNRKFNGAMDDVRIYNEALTPQQVTDLYQGGTGTKIQFEAASSGGLESESPAVIAVVVIRPQAQQSYTVGYSVTGGTAESPADYTLAPGTLTFAAGQTAAAISAAIVDDGADENDETIIVTLANPAGGDVQLGDLAQHTYTIIDPRPAVGFADATSQAGEGPQIIHRPKKIPVVLSAASVGAVTVDYSVAGGTAVRGIDYIVGGSLLSFDAGQTVKDIAVTVTDDDLQEGDETIILELSSPDGAKLGAKSQHTHTIIDNDTGEIVNKDLNNDGQVDFDDVIYLIEGWLECTLEPPELCWQ